jgi:hypothetical protein
MATATPEIFLSHSSKDKPFVRRLADDLERKGISVWLDAREMMVGDSLRQKVEEGIKTSAWLGIVISHNSVQSPWVNAELSAGFARELSEGRVFVLPMLIDDCEIPALLRDKIYADFRQDYHGGLEALLRRFQAEGPQRRTLLLAPKHIRRIRRWAPGHIALVVGVILGAVAIGVSLTTPEIRRWLGWNPGPTTRHSDIVQTVVDTARVREPRENSSPPKSKTVKPASERKLANLLKRRLGSSTPDPDPNWPPPPHGGTSDSTIIGVRWAALDPTIRVLTIAGFGFGRTAGELLLSQTTQDWVSFYPGDRLERPMMHATYGPGLLSTGVQSWTDTMIVAVVKNERFASLDTESWPIGRWHEDHWVDIPDSQPFPSLSKTSVQIRINRADRRGSAWKRVVRL